MAPPGLPPNGQKPNTLPISTVVTTGLEEGLVASSLVDPILKQNQDIVYMPPKSHVRCMQQAP
jgi:hypothetical protein